jgi:hypothetical protein
MLLNQGSGLVHPQLMIERRLPDVLDCETIIVVPFTLHFADPNEIHGHVINFGSGVDLPVQGCYQARLAADDDTIMTHPFVATYGLGE